MIYRVLYIPGGDRRISEPSTVPSRWPSAFVPASPSSLAPGARLPRWSPASSDPSPLGQAIVTVINTAVQIPNETLDEYLESNKQAHKYQ